MTINDNFRQKRMSMNQDILNGEMSGIQGMVHPGADAADLM
jgi:hypothetical protein